MLHKTGVQALLALAGEACTLHLFYLIENKNIIKTSAYKIKIVLSVISIIFSQPPSYSTTGCEVNPFKRNAERGIQSAPNI
jgi:hypothetical protein